MLLRAFLRNLAAWKRDSCCTIYNISPTYLAIKGVMLYFPQHYDADRRQFGLDIAFLL